MSSSNPENVESNVLNRLVETIEDVQKGLDPRVLAAYYRIIEKEARASCPTEELRNSIRVVQNPDLPMKFEFKSSKRAIRFVVEALENNLNTMPFATRLYFQKFEEILEKEYGAYTRK
ncbi:MAG TPA: hypothetical protein VN739_10480 [Nitrososphaerales archaeon]|nr:hypothetical protein [Nitrososphaerales archaeon]